jgi:hypothetical protein
MNIPDVDPKSLIVYCAKCLGPCAIVVLPFPGTLVSAVCRRCITKLYNEAAAAEAKEVKL